MTQYEIKATEQAVAIEITGVGGRQDDLLEAFGECREGHCSCPTDEYAKVAAMDVRPGHDRIDIELRAKPGTLLDPKEIAACLDYTVEKTSAGD